MNQSDACAKKQEAIDHFQFQGTLINEKTYGNGHINDTFLLEFSNPDQKVILQRLNHQIFTKPVEVMENIEGITSYLREQIGKEGGNPERETLNLIKAIDEKPYYQDSIGSFWRAFYFIEDAVCLEQVEKPSDFYESAVAFGHFQYMLKNYPADTLHETIPGFHDTTMRFRAFEQSVREDVCGRVKEVSPEIGFVLQRETETHVLVDLLRDGELPLRVTHNDTKLNNIMLDAKTRKGMCVIDLDTVMPGLAIYDFGDSIRFGASTAAEDEKDLSKVSCSMELFECYTRGYIEGCQGTLTKKELEMLPMGAKLMTLECGIRFLTDYLQGDVYYKIHRPEQNLDRCRTQFKLVADMESKWTQMKQIIEKYC